MSANLARMLNAAADGIDQACSDAYSVTFAELLRDAAERAQKGRFVGVDIVLIRRSRAALEARHERLHTVVARVVRDGSDLPASVRDALRSALTASPSAPPSTVTEKEPSDG